MHQSALTAAPSLRNTPPPHLNLHRLTLQAVGSGVGMMYAQMVDEEQKAQAGGAVAHSPVEKKANLSGARGFAASSSK